MASYNLAFKKSVAKDLRSIPNKDVKRILNRINSLQENPRAEGCVNSQIKKSTEYGKGFIGLFTKLETPNL